MLRPLTLVAVLLLLLASRSISGVAQEATPAATLPAAPAPGGLGRVQLPADRADIAALFARLPEAVAGETRAETDADASADRLIVAYGAVDPAFGPPLTLQALDLSSGDFFPVDFTAGAFVATVADVPDYGADAFGREGDLVWVRATTTGGVAGDRRGTPTITRPLFTLGWGNATSPWLFGATAFTPDGLDALIDAFVATAGSSPGTPPPAVTPTPGHRAGERAASDGATNEEALRGAISEALAIEASGQT